MATSPIYGFELPDDTDLVKDGALAMRTLGDDVDSTLGTALNNKLHAGLVLVKTQTIGTAVSSVTVTGAFSATYDAYKIIITGGSSAADDNMSLRLGATATGYYEVIAGGFFNGGGAQYYGAANATSWASISSTRTDGMNFDVDIRNPYLTKKTYVEGSNISSGSAFRQTGYLNNTTSYTDFTVFTSGTTMTGGTIAVYGYAKD